MTCILNGMMCHPLFIDRLLLAQQQHSLMHVYPNVYSRPMDVLFCSYNDSLLQLINNSKDRRPALPNISSLVGIGNYPHLSSMPPNICLISSSKIRKIEVQHA